MEEMENKELAIRFQEQILFSLSSLSYGQLEAMKGRIELDSPEGLESFNFAREIKKDEYGGLEVNVFHYFSPNEKILSITKEILGEHYSNSVTLGEGKMCRWFNISPMNQIEWPDIELKEGED